MSIVCVTEHKEKLVQRSSGMQTVPELYQKTSLHVEVSQLFSVKYHRVLNKFIFSSPHRLIGNNRKKSIYHNKGRVGHQKWPRFRLLC